MGSAKYIASILNKRKVTNDKHRRLSRTDGMKLAKSIRHKYPVIFKLYKINGKLQAKKPKSDSYKVVSKKSSTYNYDDFKENYKIISKKDWQALLEEINQFFDGFNQLSHELRSKKSFNQQDRIYIDNIFIDCNANLRVIDKLVKSNKSKKVTKSTAKSKTSASSDNSASSNSANDTDFTMPDDNGNK